MPNVSLELRMPNVVAVAGSMAAAVFVMRNNSGQEVSLSNGITILRDTADPVRTPDPREFFAVPRTGPIGAYELRVPPRQTREATSTAQVPFNATQVIRLRAAASLGVVPPDALFSSRVTSVQVEIPLQARAATPSDELRLELKTDEQQWCVRATDSRGAAPAQPLFLAFTLGGARGTSMMGDLPSTTGDAWAMRWAQLGSPSVLDAGSAKLTVWVGGPHYVTARADATVSAGR